MFSIRHIRRAHRYSIALLGLIGFGLLVTGLSTSASNPPTSSELIIHAMSVDGSEYPAVVATVNGRPISGKALARRIYTLTNSPAVPGGAATSSPAGAVEQRALQQLIREQVILDVADELGLTASTDEAAAFAKKQQQLFLTSDDPAAKAVYAAAAAQLGIPPGEFATQPDAVEVYRDALTRSHVYAYITSQLPPEQRNDHAAFQAALDAFIDQHTRDVTILTGR